MKAKKTIFILFITLFLCGCNILVKNIFLKKEKEVDFLQKTIEAYQAKNYIAAIYFAEQALEKDPKDVRAKYYLGCSLFESGKTEDAKKIFESILKENPSSPEAKIVRQKWLNTPEKKDEGEEEIVYKDEKIPEEEKKQIELPKFLISEPRMLEYPKLQIERSSEAIKYYQLGVEQKKKGNLVLAIASLEKAVELDPDFAPPYIDLGVAYARRGLFGKAIDALKKAQMLDPTNLIAAYNLGVIYEGRGNWTQAISEYMKVVARDPNNVMVRTRLGICLAEAGQTTAAIDQWNIAITIDPDYKEARVLLGKIYSETGDVPFMRVKYRLSYNAETHSLEYTRETEGGGEETGPLHPGYLFYDAAIEQYIEALNIDPNLAEAYAGLGFTLARAALRGKRVFHPYHKELRDTYSGAVRLKMTVGEMLQWATYYLKKAIELEPKNAYYHCNLGVIYAERGLYDPAIKHLKKSIELDSRLTAAHANLALVYSYQGKIEQARYDYEKIARIYPSDVRTIESLRVLQPEAEVKIQPITLQTTEAKPQPQISAPVPQPQQQPTTPPGSMPLLK